MRPITGKQDNAKVIIEKIAKKVISFVSFSITFHSHICTEKTPVTIVILYLLLRVGQV
jgi:hypothetical protein